MSRLKILIDHIGPLPPDDKGYTHILVMIDAFLRRVELFPTKTTGASEAAGCIFQHFGRFGTPVVIHKVEHSFATAYSKEENGIVERAIQEVMRSYFLMHACTTSGPTNSYPWYSVS